MFHDGTWAVEDRNSLNGLYVNDQKVTHQVLSPGDVVQIGISGFGDHEPIAPQPAPVRSPLIAALAG
jgi:pSer/pThr/pTyr-binding forkhead associated (FHA) protein